MKKKMLDEKRGENYRVMNLKLIINSKLFQIAALLILSCVHIVTGIYVGMRLSNLNAQ